jgi:hypothetical protein
MAGQPAEKAPHHSRPERRIKMAWNCSVTSGSNCCRSPGQTTPAIVHRCHHLSRLLGVLSRRLSRAVRPEESYPLLPHASFRVCRLAVGNEDTVGGSCTGATRRWRQRPWKSSRIGRGAQAPRLWSEWIRKPGVPCSLPFFRCWPRPRHWTRPGDKLWVPVQLQRLWIENPAITAPAALSVSAQSHKRGARSLPEQRNRDLQRAFRATEAKNQSGRRQRKQRALACPATTRPVQPSASL